jgi:hypothetical protein
MLFLTEELKEKIKKDLKGMSLYEVRVYYNIYQEDYFNNKQYTKSIIKPENDDCEFVKWWKKYKGTYQSKPFYKLEYTQWKMRYFSNYNEITMKYKS